MFVVQHTLIKVLQGYRENTDTNHHISRTTLLQSVVLQLLRSLSGFSKVPSMEHHQKEIKCLGLQTVARPPVWPCDKPATCPGCGETLFPWSDLLDLPDGVKWMRTAPWWKEENNQHSPFTQANPSENRTAASFPPSTSKAPGQRQLQRTKNLSFSSPMTTLFPQSRYRHHCSCQS